MGCNDKLQMDGTTPERRLDTYRPMDSFDLRETVIPFSLLQITNHFKQMKSGDVIEIIFRDANIVRDLNSILPESEYELIHMGNPEGDHQDFVMQLKRKPSIQSKGGNYV